MALILTGTYEVKLDAKQRLAIPSKLRDRMGKDESLFATLGEGYRIWLYPASAFIKRFEALEDSEAEDDDLLDYQRLFLANSTEVDLDAQGRIRLPESLLNRVNLDKELTVIGNLDHLEIFDRKDWQKFQKETDAKIKDNPGMLMDPRRLARRRRD